MIVSISHKGLRMYYEKGIGNKLPSEQLKKIALIFDALDAIVTENDIVCLGFGIHKLKGEYDGYWALTITGNYRIIFRYYEVDIYDIDYIDYH